MPKGISIQIVGDGESAKRALQMVETQLHEMGEAAKHEAGSVGEAMETVTRALETVGLYMGIREAIDGLKEMVKGSVELGMELGHLSKQTGISTENLSAMKYMSDATGVGLEVLTKGMKKLSMEMLAAEEGKEESIRNFKRLGISQDQVRESGNDLFKVMGLIADRFQSMPDGPKKAAEAQALFGKSGMALIPILNEGAAGITHFKAEAESLGLILNDETVERMEQLHMAADQAHGAMEGLSLSITEALLPALENIALGATKAISKLREMMGLQHTSAEDTAKQMEAYKAIPDAILAMPMSDRLDTQESAHRQKEAAEQAMRDLQSQHDANLLSDKEYAERRNQQQKDADEAELLEAQSQVVSLEEIRANAESNLHTAKSNIKKGFLDRLGYDGVGSATEQLKTFQSAYDDATKKVEAAYGTLMEAQKKAKGKTGDLELESQAPKVSKVHDDGVAKGAAALADAQAKAEADAVKSGNTTILAQLEEAHKLYLVSDAEYYQVKALLQKEDLDAEADALRRQIAATEALKAKQHSDQMKSKDAGGKARAIAEQEQSATKLVQLNQQLNDLAQKRQQIDDAYAFEQIKEAQEVKLGTLKIAADIEEQTNKTITARLGLMQYENQLAIDKAKAAGATQQVAELQALERVKEAKLQIDDVSRRIAESEEQNRLAVERVTDAVQKGRDSKKSAEKEINQLNKEEADTLRMLAAQYDALAQQLGGEYLQKAKALHAELDKLSTPSKKNDAAVVKMLGDSFESMSEQMVSASLKGGKAFHQMAAQIEEDLARLAVKLMMQQWLAPMLFNAAGGGGVPDAGGPDGAILAGLEAHADGGDINGPSVVGEKGPEIYFPKGPGTIMPNDMVSRMASGGGSSSAPNVSVNVINNSSQPVNATKGPTSFDSDARMFVQHVVLEDMSSGGPISQGLQGLGQN